MSKTIKVTELLDMANSFFVYSKDDAVKEREAVASYIGDVLHKTGNYAGFRYLGEYADPKTDKSRVSYYTSNKLKG